MNDPQAQAAAVAALRNASVEQLQELVSVLTTSCGGFITLPDQVKPAVARRIPNRGAQLNKPPAAPPTPPPSPLRAE